MWRSDVPGPPSSGGLIAKAMKIASAGRVNAWLSRHLNQIDTRAARLTGGRTTLTGLLSGLPMMVLTTVGRRSGEPRQVVLLAVPEDKEYLLVGSNYGKPHNPAWVHNLRANPDARASLRGHEATVTARELAGAERDEAWSRIVAAYPAYASYAKRVQTRTIPLFRLTPRRSRLIVQPGESTSGQSGRVSRAGRRAGHPRPTS